MRGSSSAVGGPSSSSSFRLDSTVEAVTRSKRVVQTVANNLTTLLHKIAYEDATFRVVVQEALKMKREHPDQFLFESFDEYVYDAFMKLLLTTSDELFKQVLRKGRNVPAGRTGPCDSPVFKMINRVTDHTYRQPVPRKSSEKLLKSKSGSGGSSGAAGGGGKSANAAERVDALERENEQLRLEVARCQRSIKRFTLPANLSFEALTATTAAYSNPSPGHGYGPSSAATFTAAVSNYASLAAGALGGGSITPVPGSPSSDAGSSTGSAGDEVFQTSPTARGRTLHSMAARPPRRSKKKKAMQRGSAAASAAAATVATTTSSATSSAAPTPTTAGAVDSRHPPPLPPPTNLRAAAAAAAAAAAEEAEAEAVALREQAANTHWFDYFLVLETTPAPGGRDRSSSGGGSSSSAAAPVRASREVVFRYPPTDRGDLPLDVNWGHFLTVPHEHVVTDENDSDADGGSDSGNSSNSSNNNNSNHNHTTTKKKTKTTKKPTKKKNTRKGRSPAAQAIVYSVVLNGDKFMSCVTLPSSAVPGVSDRDTRARAHGSGSGSGSDGSGVEDDPSAPELGAGSSSDDEDTIDFVDEDLVAAAASGSSSNAPSPPAGLFGGIGIGGGTHSNSNNALTASVPASPSRSAADLAQAAAEEAEARARSMTTFVLVSRVPWFQLHENVAYRLFNMLRDAARAADVSPRDFLGLCAAEASAPLPLCMPAAGAVAGAGAASRRRRGGGGGGGSKEEEDDDGDNDAAAAEPQLLAGASSLDRFRWRLQQLFNLRCSDEPAAGLLRNFPALGWTTKAAATAVARAGDTALAATSAPSASVAALLPPPQHLRMPRTLPGLYRPSDPAAVDPWCFALLHNFLSPSTIAAVLKSLLLCESVLLLSESLPLLAPIAEALRALMGPFPCSQVYIPYLPREQFHIVKSPFPFFVGSLVQDFQFVPEGVTFLTVMIEGDRAIPPLHGDDTSSVDLPRSLKLQLVARITAEYRTFAAVQTDGPEDGVTGGGPQLGGGIREETEESEAVLVETVLGAAGDDLLLDALDDELTGCESPASLGYRPSPKQKREETAYMYRALKRRMREVKAQRDASLEGSEARLTLAAELRQLAQQYKAYHSAKLLEEATATALGRSAALLLEEEQGKNAVVFTPLLQRLRLSDKQQLQPHLTGSSSNEFAVNFLRGTAGGSGGAGVGLRSSARRKATAYLEPARQQVDLLRFTAGLRAACVEMNRCLLTFFSFHDMLYNVEPEALRTHSEALEFLVRHPQGISEEGRQSNLHKLQTVEFYQALVASQNYQLFKEERLQSDDRAHELTTQFRRQSRGLLHAIIDEGDDDFRTLTAGQ